MQVTRKIFFIVLLFACNLVYAQLQTEKQSILFNTNQGAPFVIQPNHSFEQNIRFDKKDYPVRRQLRVVGGIQMPGRFAPRGEEFFRQAETLLNDNLDSLNHYRDHYSLYFKGNNNPFERHAYNRITGLDLSKNKIDFEIAVKRKQLKIANGGDFGVELQIYYKKKDRHADEVYDSPDSTIYIPIPAGTGKFKLLKKQLSLPENSAAILIRVGGTNFSGEAWLEAPRFYQDKKNLFNSAFVEDEKRKDDYNYWVGINTSTRSWPKWELKYKGKTIFHGNIFDRASDIADFYITLPDNIEGEGALELRLEKEPHRQAYAYDLHRLELLEESRRDFEIVSLPRFVSVGDTAAILIESNKANVKLNVNSKHSSIIFPEKTIELKQTGLHTISFIATEADLQVAVNITDGKEKREAYIQQIVLKERDRVYLSSGDEVHIDKEFEPYDSFFKWYFRERVGNWYQFRPSYQWSGVRITNEETISHYTSLLNKMHVPYAWQTEGRTLAATRINPSLATLQSPLFRGKQAHENDGGYYYWRHFLYKGLHSDMAARTRPYGGIFAKHRPIFTDKGIFIHYNPYGVKDMADGANKLIANLSYSRGESTRHTGPSTMFRYLYQAGYEWLGAEQMYGPEDAIMSSLRGASRAYNKKDFGSLHAVQWGSLNFTEPEHSLRFFLSLAVAYIHGSSHINCEEGLWTDEYANDRFTEAGKQHLYAQHQVLDYIETHSRKGTLNSKIAIIQGRNDAWKSFVRGPLWSQEEEKWAFNKATESFDLLKVFYPDNVLDNCSTKGLFTASPYGSVDILPIEASNEVMKQYKSLIFLGWNTFNNADFIRIKKFVEQGGTVLLTAAHLNSELQPDLPPQFPEDDTVIKTLLGLDYKSYKEKKIIPLGKGQIIYYPEGLYPADEKIRKAYTEEMTNIASEIAAEESKKAWIGSSAHIDFTVWDSEELRTFYLLNVDWESEIKSHPAKFILNEKEFRFQVERYTIATVRCKNNIAAMLKSNTSDLLSIEENEKQWIINCQTTEKDELVIFNGITGKEESREIDSPGLHRIVIKK